MVRLRGHHLVCLFFFEGDLGEREYGSNRESLLTRVEAGEPVEIVGSADDLCAWCPHLNQSRCLYKEGAEEEIARLDGMAAEYLDVSVGAVTLWRDTAQRVIDAPGVWFLQFCDTCDWRASCRRGCYT
jgi:uncharacterized protein